MVILGAVVCAGVFAPLLTAFNPDEPSFGSTLAPPSVEHPLGTDRLGRDVLARLIYGARATLLVMALSLVTGAIVGLIAGVIAGYFRGAVDSVISRVVDALLAFPTIFFGLLFAITMGAGVSSLVYAISLSLWPRFARVVRGEVLSLRERDFVAMARVNGSSTPRILRMHIVPNIANVFVVLVSLNLGYIVIVEASLSFLGAGIRPPTASWGGMISDGRDFIGTAWWLALAPGIAISATVLACNLLGDWLRDRLDPNLRDHL